LVNFAASPYDVMDPPISIRVGDVVTVSLMIIVPLITSCILLLMTRVVAESELLLGHQNRVCESNVMMDGNNSDGDVAVLIILMTPDCHNNVVRSVNNGALLATIPKLVANQLDDSDTMIVKVRLPPPNVHDPINNHHKAPKRIQQTKRPNA
jgi:hypothetical protein